MSDCNRKHYLRYSTHLTQNLTRYLGYSTHLTQSLKNLMPVLMMRSPILLKFLHLREMRLHFLGNTCTSLETPALPALALANPALAPALPTLAPALPGLSPALDALAQMSKDLLTKLTISKY